MPKPTWTLFGAILLGIVFVALIPSFRQYENAPEYAALKSNVLQDDAATDVLVREVWVLHQRIAALEKEREETKKLMAKYGRANSLSKLMGRGYKQTAMTASVDPMQWSSHMHWGR